MIKKRSRNIKKITMDKFVKTGVNSELLYKNNSLNLTEKLNDLLKKLCKMKCQLKLLIQLQISK